MFTAWSKGILATVITIVIKTQSSFKKKKNQSK